MKSVMKWMILTLGASDLKPNDILNQILNEMGQFELVGLQKDHLLKTAFDEQDQPEPGSSRIQND